MMILGALLAGGASRRFGSDKALQIIAGKTLMDHCIDRLTNQCHALIVSGRSWPDLVSVVDHPNDGGGPLCGLNAALIYAKANGFDGVVSCPIDSYPLPDNLVEMLVDNQPTAFAKQHLIGWWPVAQTDMLSKFIATGVRSVREWVAYAEARKIQDSEGLININTVDDLSAINI
jgi:molybdenum cofactor guanylyltransferase